MLMSGPIALTGGVFLALGFIVMALDFSIVSLTGKKPGRKFEAIAAPVMVMFYTLGATTLGFHIVSVFIQVYG